jgi:hypothetical protein
MVPFQYYYLNVMDKTGLRNKHLVKTRDVTTLEDFLKCIYVKLCR